MKNLSSSLIAAQMLGLVAGCSDDCPTCPQHETAGEREYTFLYGFGGRSTQPWVYEYSTKSGQILNSVQYLLDFPFYDLRYSRDGVYA